MAKRFPSAREVLNELRWREGRDPAQATVWYLHRGVPSGIAAIRASEIRDLGRSFFSTPQATIPYYKVIRITYEGEILFQRPGAPPIPPHGAPPPGDSS
jgi:uncharacterized protein (UPF0248 family)